MGGTAASVNGDVFTVEFYLGHLPGKKKVAHTIIFGHAALSKKIRSFL